MLSSEADEEKFQLGAQSSFSAGKKLLKSQTNVNGRARPFLFNSPDS
jgi:hypothetical protein